MPEPTKPPLKLSLEAVEIMLKYCNVGTNQQEVFRKLWNLLEILEVGEGQ